MNNAFCLGCCIVCQGRVGWVGGCVWHHWVGVTTGVFAWVCIYPQLLMKHLCWVFLNCQWPHFSEMNDGVLGWSHTRAFCLVTFRGTFSLLICSHCIWQAGVKSWDCGTFSFSSVRSQSRHPMFQIKCISLCLSLSLSLSNYLCLSEFDSSRDEADNSEALWHYGEVSWGFCVACQWGGASKPWIGSLSRR